MRYRLRTLMIVTFVSFTCLVILAADQEKRAPAAWEGAPDGPFVRRFPDGRKQFEGEIKGGRPSNYWRYWKPDGTLQEEGEYLDGKQHGAWLYWHKDGVRIACVQSFKNGSEDGMRTYFHANGRIQRQGWSRSGRRVGEWAEWDENGTELNRKSFDFIAP